MQLPRVIRQVARTLVPDASAWDARIARACHLADRTPAARDILTFYMRLAELQRSLCLVAVPPDDSLSSDEVAFADAVDIGTAEAAIPAFVSGLEASAPPALARALGGLQPAPDVDWRALLREGLTARDMLATTSVAAAFIVDAVLQPCAEVAAPPFRAGRRAGTVPLTSRCPVCQDLPCVGELQEEAHGAKRRLLCGRCLTDWDYLRVVCPNCGEQAFDALPVYTADVFPHVRVEACDTCRTYIKTIDLTSDGLAIPVVDDIASVTLDLWAVGSGYRRIRSNLLRLGEPVTAA